MGESSQKRLIRKLDVERFISEIKPNPSPKAHLEQYTISDQLAADILYLAAYANNDIIGKTVLDLGCGTGKLALGASFLGANMVTGIDIDKTAIALAFNNSKDKRLKSAHNWIVGDIETIVGKFDTVLQNPPFGVRTRGADRRFLEKALEVGCSIYSLHNHPNYDERLFRRLKSSRGKFLQISGSPFIRKLVEHNHGVVLAVYAMIMTIPHMFDFHTKLRQDFIVDLYVIKTTIR